MTKKKSDVEKFVLPKVKYPKLDMPKGPVTTVPENIPHIACDGEDYLPPDYTKSPIPPPPPGVKRIMIGLPILTYSHEFVQCFLKFWTELSTADKVEYEVGYHFVHRKPVHMADQVIVDMALFNKCTHVLFIDDDITGYSKAMLDSMLKADKDVIAGVMYASKFPYAMCVFRRFDTERKVIDMPVDNSMYRLYEVPCKCSKCDLTLPAWDMPHCPKCGAKQNNLLQKADLVPFCFTLMKTEIFAKLKQPWFHCTTKYPADSWFSDRCIEAGIQQWGHMGARLTHAGVNDSNKQHYFNVGLEDNKRKGTGLINLSEEDMYKHQHLLNERMAVAEKDLKHKESPQFVKSRDSKTKVVSSTEMVPVEGVQNDGQKKDRGSSVQRKKSTKTRP